MKKKDASWVKAKREPTDRILAAAETLFFKLGIRKTTIGDICRTASISRMTFYHYFPDKSHVAEAVVNRLIDDMIGTFKRIMDQDVPYSRKIAEFIDIKLNKADGMSKAFVQDLFMSPYPRIHELFRRRSEENLQIALNEFRQAQRQGHIRPGVNPEFLMVFLDILTELAVDERLVRLYSSPRELGSELMNLFFYGIIQEGKSS
jgi:AcrR family transcriptional regulator